MKRVKVVEDHERKAPAYLDFATLSQDQCRQYVGNIRKCCRTTTGMGTGRRHHRERRRQGHRNEGRQAPTSGKWTGARYVLVLNVTLYIYSFPGLECKGARDREKMWRTLANLIGTHDIPALHRLFRNAKHQTWSIKMLLKMGPAVARRKIPREGLQRS